MTIRLPEPDPDLRPGWAVVLAWAVFSAAVIGVSAWLKSAGVRF